MFKRLWKKEEGQVLVMAALLLMTLLGFAALVIDVGYMYSEKGQLQTAVDAAALAGAQELPSEEAAKNMAKSYGELNGINKNDINVTTPYNGDSTKVEVVATKNIDYVFARLLGFSKGEISARAVGINDSRWSGQALPFVNMEPLNFIAGEIFDVWGTDNVAPGNKEKIYDQQNHGVVEYTEDTITIIPIKGANGPYILMEPGVSMRNQLPIALKNIVIKGNTVYVFSLIEKYLNESNSYAHEIKNKSAIPMIHLVLLECIVEKTWNDQGNGNGNGNGNNNGNGNGNGNGNNNGNGNGKEVRLRLVNTHHWDETKNTFLLSNKGSLLVE